MSDTSNEQRATGNQQTSNRRKDGAALERLVDIMAKLRSPGGCPWDLEQDLTTLRPYLVEETYEVLEALEDGDVSEHRKELGDLLLQIVFHARIREEEGAFGFADVADAISDKLVRRHPHVFGDTTVSGKDEVLSNWAKVKAAERREAGNATPSALDGVPRALPALVRAERLGEKASHSGFDWPDVAGVRRKLDEELAEFDEALASGNRQRVEEELGDVLFAAAQLGRKASVHPEDALRASASRFERRYRSMEALAREEGTTLDDLDDAALDALWNRVKQSERDET